MRVRRAQRTSGGRLYLGTTVGRIDPWQSRVRAVAVMRAPREIATARARWLVVTASVELWSCAAGLDDALTRVMASDAWRAVRTARVVEGKAQPAPDLPRESA